MEHAQQLWVVWRRQKDSRRAWEKVPDLNPMSRQEAFQAMGQQELHSSADWEFGMVPEGERPRDSRFGGQSEPFYDGYRTKRMRPK